MRQPSSRLRHPTPARGRRGSDAGLNDMKDRSAQKDCTEVKNEVESACEEPKQRYDQRQNRRDSTAEMQINLAGWKEMV